MASGNKLHEYGRALLCHNRSQIAERILSRLMRVIEGNSGEIVELWLEHFGELKYFC